MLFLQHVVSNSCAGILVTERNAGVFGTVLEAMMGGIREGDVTVKKSCLQFFINFIKSDVVRSVDFMGWVTQKCLPGVMQVVLGDDFNAKDAQCARVAGEVAVL